MGISAWGLRIDPDQDLLVLLDIPTSGSPEAGWSGGCQIHPRTMGTNVHHPKAAAGVFPVHFTRGYPDTLPLISFSFEVLGCLLAVLFKSRCHGTESWVVVWDWHRGVELTVRAAPQQLFRCNLRSNLALQRVPAIDGSASYLSFIFLYLRSPLRALYSYPASPNPILRSLTLLELGLVHLTFTHLTPLVLLQHLHAR